MPLDFTAVTRCPWCQARNLWTFQYDDRPEVSYCRCPECERLYSLRLTRRWLDLAERHRAHPFSVLRMGVAS